MTSRRLLILLSAAFLVAGCADAKDPVALVTTTETAPALNLDVSLPTLPTLVSGVLGEAAGPGVAQRSALLSALGTWASADVVRDSAAASATRARAEAQAASPLAQALGPHRIASRIAVLERWVRLGLSTVPAGAAGLDLRRTLETAGTRLEAARAAQRSGDGAEAVRGVMSAADLLQGATPGAVAQRLVARAQQALSLADAGGGAASPDDVSTDRGRAVRLLRGAREALESGRYDLAIRRAFYAAELLGSR